MESRPVNRRRFPRISSANAVLVKMLGDEMREQFAKTNNLGLGGCRFSSRHSYPESALLQLLITLGGKVVEVVARVAYARRKPDLTFDIGVEFMIIDEDARHKIQSLLLEEEGS